MALGRNLLSAPISRFALIGAFGAVMNVLIMAALIWLGADYVTAGIIGNETTIISNFIMQEKLVFAQTIKRRRTLARRFIHSFSFNTLEGMSRVPVLWCLVELAHVPGPVAQAVTLVGAFFLRYTYHLKLIYAPAVPVKSQPSPEDGPGVPVQSEPVP
ncbi:GtrA family protein [Pseudarthrobacter sp. NamB4]|uniref:GtrA family protein n=1 Tax=Pseudarthrobacter sp. NamB4 TaxID=2576837 RepID=UPI0010FE1F50|nr:GtrA family protein [Pseudarthrobacter sp. NamB4]TLM74554.1 GtrA family protein [Pseudarthrobacter sp. NamB4]